MKKRLKWIVVLLVLVSVAVVLWPKPSPEPSYQGRPLGYWLTGLHATNDAEAALAVRTIGTNAVPYLLEGLSSSYSLRADQFYGACNRWLHYKFRLVRQPIIYPKQVRFTGSINAFEVLGSTASNALPQLTALLENPDRGMGAALAMAHVGLPAVPYLCRALTHNSPIVRYHALIAIANLGTNAAPALPSVLICLTDVNAAAHSDEIDITAILALDEMGAEARLALPTLKKFFTHPSGQVRMVSTQIVSNIESAMEKSKGEHR